MAEKPPTAKPVLQKPPGYRGPGAPPPAVPRPPPRKQQLPPSFRSVNPKRYRRGWSRRPCYCRLCCCLLVLLLFSVATVGVLSYLWFQPKLPAFHLQSLKTPEFHLAVKPDGTFLNAVTLVRVQATNPNAKIGLFYTQSQARITIEDDDGDVELGTVSFPEFAQGKKNSTMMKFESRVKSSMVDDGVASRLKVRFRSKSLKFLVEVRTRLGISVGSKRSGTLPIRVLCGKVNQKELQGGALPKCSLSFPFLFQKWINIH